MGPVELLAFALFTGITLSGIAGSVLEMIAESPLSFAEPFVSRRHIGWSMTATVLAGPMMLANDAMNARRSGAISLAMLGSCAGTALVWALAMGIVALELAVRLTTLLV